MPVKHARQIALTVPLPTWIDKQVARGAYAAASDLVRTAVGQVQVQQPAEGKTILKARQPGAAGATRVRTVRGGSPHA